MIRTVEKEVEENVIAAPARPTRVVSIANVSDTVSYWIMEDGRLKKVEDTLNVEGVDVLNIANAFFWFDSDELRSGRENMKALADLLAKFETINLEIIAYCDEFGPNEYNDLLAEKRIKAVVDYLEDSGYFRRSVVCQCKRKQRITTPLYKSKCLYR